jgi:hypothetical protein
MFRHLLRAVLVLAAVTVGYGQGAADIGTAPKLPKELESRPPRAEFKQLVPLVVPPWTDISTRASAQAAYFNGFLPTKYVAMGWSGDLSVGNAGSTSTAYQNAVLARINWIRQFSGVPPISALNSTYNSNDQQAAMMMSVNNQLSHSPPSTWTFYSAAGALAASNSNLCLGMSTTDPGCIELYMQDFGSNNTEVGHRRWILYPQTQNMGTGDVASQGAYNSANALWVIESATYSNPRPATRDGFVAWPSNGYMPYELMPVRWSFSYPGADFTSAVVTMTRNGGSVPITPQPQAQGYGENTIVWVPDNQDPNIYSTPTPPASDTTNLVTISNVKINGSPTSFSYAVTVFDPNVYPAGASFSFNPTSTSIPASGGAGTVVLTVSPSGTVWGATSNASWLTITSGASGTGSGSISYSATNNSSSGSRSAKISVGQSVFSVTQSGLPCTYTVSAASFSFGPGAGNGVIPYTVSPTDCGVQWSWDNSWLNATQGSSGLNFTVAPNTGTARVGHITISGQTVVINQAAQGTVATSRVGIFNPAQSVFLLDSNGNFAWNGTPTDMFFPWGTANHNPKYIVVMGDWNGSGTRKVGIFDPATAIWLLDYNGDGVYTPGVDKYFAWGSPGDIPVIGDWNGSGTTKIGTFGPTTGLWLLDYNGNFAWDGPSVDKYFPWGSAGDTPVVGDWNGSGTTKVGTFGPNTGLWLLDYNGNFAWDGPSVDKYFPWGSGGDTPVVGNWNGSGTAKVGTFGPKTGLWLLDYNGNFSWDGPAVDKYFPWGSGGDTPVIGDWNGSGTSKVGTFGPGTALWLLDYNGNFTWDGSSVDKYFPWGSAGDTPVILR